MKASSSLVIANFYVTANSWQEFSNHTTWHRRRMVCVSQGILPWTLLKDRVWVLHCRLLYPEEDMSVLIWFKVQGIRPFLLFLVTNFLQGGIAGCGDLWSYQLEESTIWVWIQTFLCFCASGREVWSAWGDFQFDKLARIWLGLLPTSSIRESWPAQVCHLPNLCVSTIEEDHSPTSSWRFQFLEDLGSCWMSWWMPSSQYKVWSSLYRCGFRWLLKVTFFNNFFVFTIFQIANCEKAKEMESTTSRQQKSGWRQFNSTRFDCFYIPSWQYQFIESRSSNSVFKWENVFVAMYFNHLVHQIPRMKLLHLKFLVCSRTRRWSVPPIDLSLEVVVVAFLVWDHVLILSDRSTWTRNAVIRFWNWFDYLGFVALS